MQGTNLQGKAEKETNTITVMWLHRCLIIRDKDKRIKCHPKDSGYLVAASSIGSTKQGGNPH